MDINFSFDSKKADDHFSAVLVVSNPEFNGKHAIFTIEH